MYSCSAFLYETSKALRVLVWGKEECLKTALERLRSKNDVLETVRQRVPGFTTGCRLELSMGCVDPWVGLG